MSGSSNEKLQVEEYFGAIVTEPIAPFIADAEAIERDAKIEDHEFFRFAIGKANVLRAWAGQEAAVTNPFSQVLLSAISQIKNVHLRSILLPVVTGEHSAVRGGIASRSHPWLAWKLCSSLGLKEGDIVISPATKSFIQVLKSSLHNPMHALGVIGIGNELILLAEYRAIEECFARTLPDSNYRDFLQANLTEDEGHSRLIALGATALSNMGHAPNDFLNGAREGVSARIRYYDALLDEVRALS